MKYKINFSKTLKRFWGKVRKTDTCWIWTGARTSKKGKSRYGNISFQGKRWLAHRFSWMIHNGKINKNMCVLHHCDNPPCINPDHLFLGTIADNNHDAIKKGRGILMRYNIRQNLKHVAPNNI